MHTIQPARLLPGVSAARLGPAESNGGIATTAAKGLIHGKALVFWDLKAKAKKLDAIDTDQITPAADCVSESLDTLDERWKAGSFRYLMPGFRERVHRGETFLIAGDRFAIGSSREMSPAGLKAVAEEAGLQSHFFEDAAEAGEYARAVAQPGDAVLFKGSRGVHVERALERFLA